MQLIPNIPAPLVFSNYLISFKKVDQNVKGRDTYSATVAGIFVSPLLI